MPMAAFATNDRESAAMMARGGGPAQLTAKAKSAAKLNWSAEFTATSGSRKRINAHDGEASAHSTSSSRNSAHQSRSGSLSSARSPGTPNTNQKMIVHSSGS